jgi:hypothetical protein
MKSIFILHHTHTLQDYNDHTLFLTKEEALAEFNLWVAEANADGIGEIHNETEEELYFEGLEGSEKFYITEHVLYKQSK